VAPILVFTPAEWKLRYYLLPSLPPMALLVAPTLVRLLETPVLPLRATRASALAAAGLAVGGVVGILLYLGHPTILSASDQLTRDALLRALGGSRPSALVFSVLLATVAVAIGCRAWGGLAVLVAIARLAWMVVGDPRWMRRRPAAIRSKPFAPAAAARFPAGHPLAF
jgi:hypothetical protein